MFARHVRTPKAAAMEVGRRGASVCVRDISHRVSAAGLPPQLSLASNFARKTGNAKSVNRFIRRRPSRLSLFWQNSHPGPLGRGSIQLNFNRLFNWLFNSLSIVLWDTLWYYSKTPIRIAVVVPSLLRTIIKAKSPKAILCGAKSLIIHPFSEVVLGGDSFSRLSLTLATMKICWLIIQ